MIKDGEWLNALLYLNGTFFGSSAAFLLGLFLAKKVPTP
jgi:fluoride ion exporter CrcB/FEX